MNVEFIGKIASARMDVASGSAALSIRSKLKEMDDDTRDHLAELVTLLLPADMHITVEETGEIIELECVVDGFRANMAEGVAAISFKVPRAQITAGFEKSIAQAVRMGWAVLVNVLNRQMTFNDLKIPREIEKVTMTYGNRTVDLKGGK